MTEERISFTCRNCMEKNYLDFSSIKDKLGKTRVILFCRSCGTVHMSQGIDKNDDSLLECIVSTSPESIVPTGRYIDPATGKTLWQGSNGKTLTTDEFMMRHGINPEIYWRNKEDLEARMQQS